jgi:peptidyl-dipeptidase Dcp
MAVDPARADELMMKVWKPAVKRVAEEVADMKKIAGKKIKIEPWDYLYYAEKVRKKKYDLDTEALKPYFELNNMIAASFYMAEQLYGMTFKEITGEVPVFQPDVRVWEVQRNGEYLGLFYGDYFARAGKRSGAWMTEYQSHETFTGKTVTPIVSNNNNFVKAGEDEPILISLDDATTLFHEFGHAIHGLLSEVNYPTFGNIPRDFVEYPSQVHEMWVMTRPILDKFGKHYKTGKPMPQKLLDKVEAAKKFNQGYETVEYLEAAIVDMRLHTRADGNVDPDAFERETLEEIGAPREIALRHRLPQFLHLFGDDSYSAGYYSYLWADTLTADAAEAFEEAPGGYFDRAVADRLRSTVFAVGDTMEPADSFRAFRGRDVDTAALMRKRGFPVPDQMGAGGGD